jgi:hypothetical protein
MVAALIFTLGYLATIFVLRANGIGFRGKEVTFQQATTTLQVTYAIEIIYYLCVNAIKISILFFYLRIGKLIPPAFTKILLTGMQSCRENLRTSLQGYNLPTRHLLSRLYHRHSSAMSSTLQDVGPHWYGTGKLYQHFDLHIQYGAYPKPGGNSSNSITSNKCNQHHHRHMDTHPPHQSHPQHPTSRARKVRSPRHLRPRCILLRRLHCTTILRTRLYSRKSEIPTTNAYLLSRSCSLGRANSPDSPLTPSSTPSPSTPGPSSRSTSVSGALPFRPSKPCSRKRSALARNIPCRTDTNTTGARGVESAIV